MQYPHLFKAWWAIAFAGALLAGFYPLASAADASKRKNIVKPLVLHKIMLNLEKDMQAVSQGIAREDWALVERTAPRIANHPQPPMGERLRILAFIGGDVGKFKEYDKQTSQSARALKKFALQGDERAVISTFATLQESCLACHEEFLEPFQEHFYGRR